MIDKYNNLAREALSTGDKILSENYLQHADHFSRVLELQEIKKINNNNLDNSNNVIEQNFAKETENIKSDSKDQIAIDNQNSKSD